jgi:NLR family CARD domain-containing protein 3
MCKQVVGSLHIGDLCSAVAKGPPGKVRHFLLGNNVCCEASPTEGAESLASLIADRRQGIQTWYLAGNAINEESIRIIAHAFEDNAAAEALWLKRNPIRAGGAAHLAKMLTVNTSLTLLDLSNTGLLDDGVAALLNPLINCKTRVHLRHLYLGGNGITATGAETIARFIEAHPYALETLYLPMNRIGNAGAVRIAEALAQTAERAGGCQPALKRLSFASCRLDESGLDSMSRAAEVCQLVCLDIGYYKATRDLGERANSFASTSEAQIARLVNSCPGLRFLGVTHAFNAQALSWLRAAARLRGGLWLEDGFGNGAPALPIPAARGGMCDKDMRAGIRHPECAVHIDSIYRDKM